MVWFGHFSRVAPHHFSSCFCSILLWHNRKHAPDKGVMVTECSRICVNVVIQEIFLCHVFCRITGSMSSASVTNWIFLLPETSSALQSNKCVCSVLSIESPKCSIPLGLGLPGLVLYWLVEVLHQILQCHISYVGVGAKSATDSSNKPPNIHRAVV